MAATIARAQGFTKDGSPKAGEATRLGSGYAVAQANTWETFISVTTWGDGHSEVEIKRDGRLVAVVRVNAEGDPETLVTLLDGEYKQCYGKVRRSSCVG